MARNAAPRRFARSRGFVRRRIWIGLAIVLLVLPSLSAHVFLWRLERRLGLKIDSKPFFIPWPGFMKVRENLRLEWSDQLQVTSGSLSVWFPLTALVLNRYSISMEGHNLMVEPGSELRGVIGQNQVFFDRFSAKLVMNSHRISEIEYLDAESKTIEFHLNRKSAERKQQEIPHGT